MKLFNESVKIAFFTLAFSCFISSSFAQSNSKSMDEPAIEKAKYFNQKNGLPAYSGIFEQYTITVDQEEALAKYQDDLRSGIKKMEGISDCIIDVPNKLIIVKVPKEGAKESRESNLEKIKTKIAASDLRMLSYTEATCKQ